MASLDGFPSQSCASVCPFRPQARRASLQRTATGQRWNNVAAPARLGHAAGGRRQRSTAPREAGVRHRKNLRCRKHEWPRARWNTHARWAAMLVSRRELRVLVTTANGPQLLEHVDQPNVYWARNCSGTRHWGRELFRSNFTATLGCSGWTFSSGPRGAFCWGRGHWRNVLFAWVFGRAHELAMDFHKHQQSQLFGLYMAMSLEPFDRATDLSKEASDGNLWKLRPTPSRRKLRVFVRTGSHTSFV